MKKTITLFLSVIMLIAALPLAACAEENTVPYQDAGYAVILDKNGTVIEELDMEVSLTQENKTRSGATTYSLTYSATKADSNAGNKEGVTAAGTITWIDTTGPDNVLYSISGSWDPGYRTLSNRTTTHGARNMLSQDLITPITFTESGNSFYHSGNSLTGYQFYLRTSATINETGDTIVVIVTTSITT